MFSWFKNQKGKNFLSTCEKRYKNAYYILITAKKFFYYDFYNKRLFKHFPGFFENVQCSQCNFQRKFHAAGKKFKL